MNFAELVEFAQRRGKKPTQAPRTIGFLAARCQISRTYMYDLMSGRKSPREHTTHKIARGLAVSFETVRDALAVTKAEETDAE